MTKLTKFNYVHEPMDHQARAVNMLLDKDITRYALFWEMGTGKSKVAIDWFCQLFKQGKINGVVIVAEKGYYLNWSSSEIPKHTLPSVDYRVGIYDSHPRAEERKRLEWVISPEPETLDILLINVEALSTAKGGEYLDRFIKNHQCLCIVDESDCIANIKAKRTLALVNRRHLFPYRFIMTGTPVAQGPLDLWGQCAFLGSDLLQQRSYTAFRAEYAVLKEVIMGPRRFIKVDGYKNLDKLHNLIQPFSSRILKSECMDLPEKVYEEVQVEHTEEQARAYATIKDQFVMNAGSGIITVQNALTLVLRLQQINSGFIKTDDGELVEIPHNRISMLHGVMRLISGKAIIWCNFRHDVESVTQFIAETYGNGSVVSYYGETEMDDRVAAVQGFMTDPKVRWFVANQASASRSLTLTSASYAVYYSNNYSLRQRLQSEDRIHRKGQVNQCTYIDLVTPRTVDTKILLAHKNKKEVADSILDIARDALNES